MYGAAESSRPAVRRGAQLALAFAVIAAALVVMVGLISYSRSTGQLRAVSLAAAGNEYLVASALMKHAQDKAFDENPPVPDNIAALAKEAEDEMKLDAEVMKTGKIPA